MIFIRTVLIVALLVTTSDALAQESPLGSPAKQARAFSSDYAQVVRDGTPAVDAPGLRRLLTEVATAAAAEKPLAIASVRQLEAFFGLRQRAAEKSTDITETGEAAYFFNPMETRIYLVRRYRDVQPVTREAFANETATIRAAHGDLVKRLGIPPQGVFFTDFRETLSQTDGHPTRQGGSTGPIRVEGATTTILRSVGGIIVDGSYIRLSSIDAKRLEAVDIRWPRVRLAAKVAKNGIRTPRDVTVTIARRVAANANGLPVAVRMAVVLRAVKEASGVAFVPALRVGVEPKSIPVSDGFRTDAGEGFYVDLVRGSRDFADEDERDAPASRE